MTDAPEERDERELRARLRAGDPAASLHPADPHRVARLLEDTMAEPIRGTTADPRSELAAAATAPPADGVRADGVPGPRRGPLTWLVAAAAVLLIVGGIAFALLNLGDGPADAPVAGPPGSATARTSTTVLTAPAARGTARCLPPNATTLRGQDVAVDATATEVAGRQVTLVPNRFYAGARTDAVVVRAAPSELSALVGAVRFREGRRYLVSASNGEVSVCGLSAPWSQQLADLYAEAFGA